ncbi:MAG: hypothetical protein C5B50_01970 [Verrucomicrobia bacterium]|nr:MAG: hypothetical protein C5B50_01970 [Verrucomicrobiota bacterium]
MSDCARALLDYYAISLSVEPCLLFVNPEIPKNYCIVALDDEDPVRSLLADILAPMSQAFRGLSAYWRDMDRLRWRERELKEAQKTADSAPAEICTLNGSLKRAKSARKESERPERRMADERRIEILKGLLQAFEENWKDADLRLSEVPGAEQFSQELKGFEMSRRYCAAVEQDLSLIQADADNFRVVDKRNKLKATLRRSQNKRWTRLGQIRRQLTDETKRIQGFSEKCQQEIRWLNDQIARAQQRLEDARNLLHSQDENQDMANRTTLVNKQTAFRNEGYPEETLTSENPSAFSVIETLSRNGRVGRMQPNHATSQWRGNPSRLEALVRTRHTRNETIHLDKNMSDTTAKKILDSALTALLKGLELSPWIKVPATFISELSKRFSSLPPEEKHELAKARQDAIVSSIPAAALNGTPPQPNVLAKAIQEAVFRAILLDHLYGLTLPDLNELINRIEKARPNVSETAPRKTQVAQLVDWVESSEGPGLSELASKARF